MVCATEYSDWQTAFFGFSAVFDAMFTDLGQWIRRDPIKCHKVAKKITLSVD